MISSGSSETRWHTSSFRALPVCQTVTVLSSEHLHDSEILLIAGYSNRAQDESVLPANNALLLVYPHP